MKKRIVGWLMCVMMKMSNLSSSRQFALYFILLIVPSVIGLVISQTHLSILVIIYLVIVCAVITSGYRMIGNGKKN